MIDFYRDIYLDFVARLHPPTAECIHNGADWYLRIHLYENGQPEIVPDGYSARLVYVFSDGQHEELTNEDEAGLFSISENTVTLKIPESILERHWPVQCYIRLENEEKGVRLTAPVFWIRSSHNPGVLFGAMAKKHLEDNFGYMEESE